jgi:DNA-binding NtrC family response regulator
VADSAPATLQDADIQLAVCTHVPVLITCASASKREECARLIHAQSGAADGPFVTFRNAGSAESTPAGLRIPTDRVSINGALGHRFEEARQGTLFIEDIAGLTVDAQLELLSLLDTPSRQPHDGAVRVVAGASHHLDAERRSGAFNDRLFYRLNVIHVDWLA